MRWFRWQAAPMETSVPEMVCVVNVAPMLDCMPLTITLYVASVNSPAGKPITKT